MQLSDAAKVVTPRSICVAVAAALASVADFERAYPLYLRKLVSRPCDIHSYSSLLEQLSSFSLKYLDEAAPELASLDIDDDDNSPPYGTAAHYVYHRLKSVDSVERLHDVVESFVPADSESDALLHQVYDVESPIACYLRKISTLFSSLSFEATNDLVEELTLFRNGHDTNVDKVCLSCNTGRDENQDIAVNGRVNLHKTAQSLASGLPVENDCSFRMLAEELGKDDPIADYVLHLETFRRRDFASASDLLHRYHDLSLSEISRAGNGASARTGSGNTAQGAGVPSTEDGNRSGLDSRGHQYAALSLAALHFNFGHVENAKAALHDAVRAAQQCNDEACQAQALALIARLSESPEQRHQLLRHGKDRLALAREEIQSVVSPFAKQSRIVVPAEPHESFWHHEHRHFLAISSARMQRIHSLVGVSKGDLRVDSLLLSAAAWESHASVPTALTIARTALSLSKRKYSTTPSRLSRTEAQALVAVANLEAKMGAVEFAITQLEERAGTDVKSAKNSLAWSESSPLPERELLLRCSTWLKFERALRRGECEIARTLTERIQTFASCNVEQNIVGGRDSELDYLEASCRLQIWLQSYRQAARLADKLVRRAAALMQPVRVIEGLRLNAEVCLHSGSAISALPSILSGVSLARGLGLEAAYVRSMLTLVDSMLRIECNGSTEFAFNALKSLQDVLPRALEGLGLQERGRANKLHAECVLANSPVPLQKHVGQSVLKLLEAAIADYATVEDKFGQRSCWYLVARIHHQLGESDVRDDAAAEFRRHCQDIHRASWAKMRM